MFYFVVLEYIPVDVLQESGNLQFFDPLEMGRAVIGKNIQAILGISIKLACPYVGTPKPTISWYVNGNIIKNDAKYSIGKATDDMIIPRISKIMLESIHVLLLKGK